MLRDNDTLDPQRQDGERVVDLALRPKSLAEFIGQAKMKQNLNVFLTAARQREEALDHTL